MNEVGIMDRALFNQVPSEVIFNILSRLPTKTCLNCKLVRKEWYQIIVSTEFTEHRSKHCPYSTIILHPYSINLFEEWLHGSKIDFSLLDIDKSSFKVDEMSELVTGVDTVVSFKPKFNIPLDESAYFINECNGLVLLISSEMRDTWVVCNLLTGEQVIVDQCPDTSSTADYMLGCCPVSHQFKVLRRGKKMANVLEIKTLGTNEWRTIGTISPYIKKLSDGAFLHGSLHQCSREGHIWALWSFDFEKEQFLEVPLPSELEGHSKYLELDAFVFESCLCLTASQTSTTKECKIWMMKEYGVKDSWVEQYAIRTVKSHPCMPLLHFNTGEKLFNYRKSLYLGECDTDSRSWKELKVRGDSSFKVIVPYHVKFCKSPCMINSTIMEMN